MRHVASARFWRLYEELLATVQDLADKSFELLKANPRHPALHFKKIGPLWSVRVGALLGGTIRHSPMAYEREYVGIVVAGRRFICSGH